MGVLLGKAWKAAVLGFTFGIVIVPFSANGQAQKHIQYHVRQVMKRRKPESFQ